MLFGRGYKASMLNEVMAMARAMDMDQALKRVQKESAQERFRFILTYEPKLPSIPSILVRTWETMVDRDRRQGGSRGVLSAPTLELLLTQGVGGYPSLWRTTPYSPEHDLYR